MREIDLSVVDLFAGCGGFGLGLEQAGFTPVFVNELNNDARATYIINRKGRHEWFADDLDERTWLNPFSSSDAKALARSGRHLSELQSLLKGTFGINQGEIDLVIGGPPCQGFSGIGHRRSYSVEKHDLPSNHLYKDMAKIVGHLRPRAFVFENVRGLLTSRWTEDSDKGEIWQAVKRAFAKIGDYTLASQLVFAKNYGVAQNRPRVLLVGIRQDVVGLPPTKPREVQEIDDTAYSRGFLPQGKSGTAPNLADLLGDLIERPHVNGGQTLVYPSGASTPTQREFRTSADRKTIARLGDPVSEHAYSKHSRAVIERFQAMIHGCPFHETSKFAQRVLPREWGPCGPSITATSLPDDYVHFEQPRTLTVREWARLQGFPDWYQFMGKRTTGGIRRAGNPREGLHYRELPKYTQIGNAVPVQMARAVGRHLARILHRGSVPSVSMSRSHTRVA